MDIRVNVPQDTAILDNLTDAHVVAVVDSMRRGEVTNIVATRRGVDLHPSFGLPFDTLAKIYAYALAHPEKNYQPTVADFIRAGYDQGVFHAPRGLMESLSATGAGMFFGALAGGALMQQLNVAGTSMSAAGNTASAASNTIGAAGETVSTWGTASSVSPEFAASMLGEAPISATIGGFLPVAPVTGGFLTSAAMDATVKSALAAGGSAASLALTAAAAPKPKAPATLAPQTAPQSAGSGGLILAGIAALAAVLFLT